MTFDEVLDQVRELLQQRGRVTYRSLKRRFALDDEYVEDLKGELIRAEGVAADEDGDVLVWTGGKSPTASADESPRSHAQRLRLRHILLLLIPRHPDRSTGTPRASGAS